MFKNGDRVRIDHIESYYDGEIGTVQKESDHHWVHIHMDKYIGSIHMLKIFRPDHVMLICEAKELEDKDRQGEPITESDVKLWAWEAEKKGVKI